MRLQSTATSDDSPTQAESELGAVQYMSVKVSFSVFALIYKRSDIGREREMTSATVPLSVGLVSMETGWAYLSLLLVCLQ